MKAELLEAAAFETESRQEATFKVPSKAVAQIVGKGGATINAIKNDTGAQIDIEREGGEDKQTTITVRGDKQAIAAAKEAVLNVVKEVGDETTVELTIEQKYVSRVRRYSQSAIDTGISTETSLVKEAKTFVISSLLLVVLPRVTSKLVLSLCMF